MTEERMPVEINDQERKLRKVEGVQVFAVPDARGRAARVEAIDENGATIRAIADRLQRRGYGVLRSSKPRAGRTFHTLRAQWASGGDPPEDPFDDDG